MDEDQEIRGDASQAVRGAQGRKAFLLASFVAQACALARYVLLARLLGPEQLGLASILILAMQFFDTVADSGADRFLVQDRDGDSPEVQKVVHLAYLGRGVFTTIGLVLAAYPLSLYFDSPALMIGLWGTALAPLIGSFLHLDFRRAQRTNNFRPEATGILVAECASLVATAIAAFILRDFTAAIYGFVVRSLGLVIVSHVTAQRAYAAGFSEEHMPRLVRFAIPLMLNGVLLFIGGQGDRLVIASELGVTELGRYTAILLLILYPTSMLMRYLSVIYLPRIAAERSSPSRGTANAELGSLCLLMAICMAVGFALVAPTVSVLLYGPEFKQPLLLVALIGLLQANRFIRQWPTTIALAMGESSIVLRSSAARMLGLAAAILGERIIGGLDGMILGLIFGELLALATTLLMINAKTQGGGLADLNRFAQFVTASACLVGWAALIHGPLIDSLLLASLTTLCVLWLLFSEIHTVRAFTGTLRRALSSGILRQR